MHINSKPFSVSDEMVQNANCLSRCDHAKEMHKIEARDTKEWAAVNSQLSSAIF